MNLAALLQFLPLIIGAFLAYHLIFKQQLPTKSLGAIITYFLGIIIVFAAISWLIVGFLAGWATDLLQAGTSSTQWNQFVNQSEAVLDEALNSNDTSSNNPTTVNNNSPSPAINVQPTPIPTIPPGVSAGPGENAVTGRTGSTYYTVQSGDTLSKIGERFGVHYQKIIDANGLTSWLIHEGDVLLIPAPTP